MLRGLVLNYNVADQKNYEKDLTDLVRTMTREVKRRIQSLFQTQTASSFFVQDAKDDGIADKAEKLMLSLTTKFFALFDRKAQTLAEQMLRRTLKTSKTTLHESLKELSGGLSLKTGVIPEGMETVASAIVKENVELIKTIPQQYLSKIHTAVMNSISTGNGLAELLPQVRKYSKQSDRKVELLALDQTRKAYSLINVRRLEDLGVKKFEWIHSHGGQKPRKSHIAMSGKIFRFDKPPIINKEQVARGYEEAIHGYPGQIYNCKCTSRPVIEFEER